MTWTVRELERDEEILPTLQADRVWAAYGLCDLSQPYRSHSRYLGALRSGRVQTIAVIFSMPGITAFIPFGSREGLDALIEIACELPEKSIFMVRTGELSSLRRRYRIERTMNMYRMYLAPDTMHPERGSHAHIRALTLDDLPAAQELYRHDAEMQANETALQHGVTCGAWRDGELVAIAGTHALTESYNMATIGGVLTRPDHRSKGLGKAVTSAVVDALRARGIEEVALNVKQGNVAAIHAYQAVGFRLAMPFIEGSMTLLPSLGI